MQANDSVFSKRLYSERNDKKFLYSNNSVWPVGGHCGSIFCGKPDGANQFIGYQAVCSKCYIVLCGISCSVFSHHLYCVLYAVYKRAAKGQEILSAFKKGEPAVSR